MSSHYSYEFAREFPTLRSYLKAAPWSGPGCAANFGPSMDPTSDIITWARENAGTLPLGVRIQWETSLADGLARAVVVSHRWEDDSPGAWAEGFKVFRQKMIGQAAAFSMALGCKRHLAESPRIDNFSTPSRACIRDYFKWLLPGAVLAKDDKSVSIGAVRIALRFGKPLTLILEISGKPFMSYPLRDQDYAIGEGIKFRAWLDAACHRVMLATTPVEPFGMDTNPPTALELEGWDLGLN